MFDSMNARKAAFFVALAAVFAVYFSFNPPRVEHGVLLGVYPALVLTERTRRMAMTWLPAIIFVFVYDFMRVFDAMARDRVSIGDVDRWELALMGIPTATGVMSPVEFLGQFSHPIVDLLGGVVYASHLLVAILVGIYFSWQRHKEDHLRVHLYLWGLLLLHVLALVIQVVFPVAPPWFHLQPLGPHEVIGNAANLLRVDELIGFPYFEGVYSQSAYVFGAMPSLHVAVPVWVTLWLKGWWRMAAAAFSLIMAFYAVYLGHHFVLDLIAGALLAVFVWFVMQRVGEVWKSHERATDQ
jgi:membrane-associated phospholipid phosphatase